MRINGITTNYYNTKAFTRNNQKNNVRQNFQTQTAPAFTGNNSDDKSGNGMRGLLKGASGLVLLSALSGGMNSCSDVIGGEDDIKIDQVHNIKAAVDSVPIHTDPIIIHTRDTVEKIIPGKDSIVYRDSIINKIDTIKIPEYITLPPDTLYYPVEIHDTIPGETKYVFYEKPLNPEISEKEKEILEDLGIKVEGSGDYVLASEFVNEYGDEGPYQESRQLNMDLCSRDGSKYVYDAIRTGTTYDPEEGMKMIILGKNQKFVRYEYTLSDDKKSLFYRTFVPRDEISISNDRGERNWDAFDGQLKQHSKWKELQTERGEIELSKVKGGLYAVLAGGVKVGEVSRGEEDQSVKYVNNYEGEQRFSDIRIYLGGKYEPFDDPETQEKYEKGQLNK